MVLLLQQHLSVIEKRKGIPFFFQFTSKIGLILPVLFMIVQHPLLSRLELIARFWYV